MARAGRLGGRWKGVVHETTPARGAEGGDAGRGAVSLGGRGGRQVVAVPHGGSRIPGLRRPGCGNLAAAHLAGGSWLGRMAASRSGYGGRGGGGGSTGGEIQGGWQRGERGGVTEVGGAAGA